VTQQRQGTANKEEYTEFQQDNTKGMTGSIASKAAVQSLKLLLLYTHPNMRASEALDCADTHKTAMLHCTAAL
jgi:hypothetical protein